MVICLGPCDSRGVTASFTCCRQIYFGGNYNKRRKFAALCWPLMLLQHPVLVLSSPGFVWASKQGGMGAGNEESLFDLCRRQRNEERERGSSEREHAREQSQVLWEPTENCLFGWTGIIKDSDVVRYINGPLKASDQ